jgi:predicted RNA-binding protein with PIN domain
MALRYCRLIIRLWLIYYLCSASSGKGFQMYIIDGYNLLWSVHKACEHPEDISQIQLCRLVSGYLRALGQQGQIVFDGIGPPDRTPFDFISGLEVMFSGGGKDADGFIEAKMRADSAPKRFTVVSSDRRIRTAAKACKAASVKSEQFWRDMVAVLRGRIRVQEPAEKRKGLDQAQTEQWLKYFGFDQ